jgi:uncharacterized protein YdaU (DUF1376 family)
MHYYSHNISDFNNATRHLTRVERSIYLDMLYLYYDTEVPLPLDKRLLCRKVIARTEEEVTAVEQVLNEFFIETASGWFNARCDEEIAEYHKTTSDKSKAGKASAEKRRLEQEKRLQELNRNSTAAEQVLESVDVPVQLTSNYELVTSKPINPPTTTTEPITELTTDNAQNDAAVRGVVVLPHVELSKTFRAHGVMTQPADPRLLKLVQQGVTPEVVASACEEAKRSKPDETIGFAYVLKIIERWSAEAKKLKTEGAKPPEPRVTPWWTSDALIAAEGAKYGITSYAGESTADFKGRIQAAIDRKAMGITAPAAQSAVMTTILPPEPVKRDMSPEAVKAREEHLAALRGALGGLKNPVLADDDGD